MGYDAAVGASAWWWSLHLFQGATPRGLCRGVSSMSGAWDVALTLLVAAAGRRVQADLAVHTAALSALAGNDEWRATLQLAVGLHGLVAPVAVAAARGRKWSSVLWALEDRRWTPRA